MIRASLYTPLLRWKRDLLADALGLAGPPVWALHTQGSARISQQYPEHLATLEMGDVVVFWVDDMLPWPGIVTKPDEVAGLSADFAISPMSWILTKRICTPPQQMMSLGEILQFLERAANSRVKTPIREFGVGVGVGSVSGGMAIDLKGLRSTGGVKISDVLNFIARDYHLNWAVRWGGAEDNDKAYGILRILPEESRMPIRTFSLEDTVGEVEIASDLDKTINSLIVISNQGSLFNRTRVLIEDEASIGQYGLLQGTIETIGAKTEAEAKKLLKRFSRPQITIAAAIKREKARGVFPGETIKLVLDAGRTYMMNITGMTLTSDLSAVVLKGDSYEEVAV